MNEHLLTYSKIFTYAFLGIALLSFSAPAVSLTLTGRELYLFAHPIIVRIRFFGLGLLTALWTQKFDWNNPGAIGLLTALLLLISSARTTTSQARYKSPPLPKTPPVA